jgi:RimJ/RimL family protein N-acetyltransferase
MFRLETERLVIREWDPSDRDAFRHLAQDPVVMRYINDGVPLSEDEIDAALARQRRNAKELGFCMGALVEKASGEVVGVAGLQPLGTTGDLEIGWWLAPRLWGHGYATEAGAAAMQHVLGALGRTRVVAIIDPPNEASKRVATRLGLRLERRTNGVELGHRLPDIVVDLFSLETVEPGRGEESAAGADASG